MSQSVRTLVLWVFGTLVAAICLFQGVQSLDSGPSSLQRDLDRVQALLEQGAYGQAESDAAGLVERFQLPGDAPSITSLRALDLLVAARVRNGKGGEQLTLEMAARVVRLKEGLAGTEHPEVATSLQNLGDVYLDRGEPTAAVGAHERALSIHTRRYGDNHAATIGSLESVALTQIMLEKFDAARSKVARAVAARETRGDEEPLPLARALQLQALLNRYTGDYASAKSLVHRILDIRAHHSPSHPESVTLYQVQGDVLFLQGDINGAQHAWSEGLALAESTLGPDHPALSPILRKLAGTADAVGRRSEGKRFLDRALTIGSERLAPCHPEVIWLLNDAAQSKSRDGDFAEAQKIYQRELETIEKCHGPANSKATALHNYANLAAEMGDLNQAERLHERAIAVWSAGLGSNHPYVARGIDSLAEVVASRGQHARAKELYEQALAIRRRASTEDRPEVAWTLTNLGQTVAALGTPMAALRHVDRAIAIYRKHGAFDEPDHFARALELRGELQAGGGDVRAAKTSLTEALAERTRIFGESHPLVAQTRATLAAIDFRRGNVTAALAGALLAERSGREHLLFTARYLPERSALAYAAKRPRGLDLALTMAAANAAEPRVIFDALIRSRGVLLDEFAARHRAVIEPSGDIAPLVSAATSARQRLANLMVRSLQEPVSRVLLDQAREQKDVAERSLAERSADARAELMRASAGLEEVSRALPSNAALVAFVQYERTPSSNHARRSSSAELWYAAFAMRAGSREIHFVSIGDVARVDSLIKAWRDEASGRAFEDGQSRARAERAYQEMSTRLRRAVWDPLVPRVGAASRVFIVPDGLLNVVNLAALHDHSGRYLAEASTVMHYLTTERDLLLQPADQQAASTLLAVGGPAFDGLTPAARTASDRRNSDCASLVNAKFESLPGSLSEVAEITAIWTESKSGPVTLLQGSAATESAVKGSVTGRRIVHLATHGFFLGKDCAGTVPGRRAVGGLAAASTDSVLMENPLLLTGLAFAGANNRSEATIDQDEGLLTAEEIAGLNLRGTEWAVLSACDTGLGAIKAGEGVFGLRRAFQIAGARTVIMSLWSVEDESAREWMRALYQERLERRLDTAAAVHEAGLTVLRARRAKGLSTHPFYWAAFVAAGDWR